MPVMEYMEREVGRVRNIYKEFMVDETVGVTDQWGLGLEEWEMNRGLEGRDWRMS